MQEFADLGINFTTRPTISVVRGVHRRNAEDDIMVHDAKCEDNTLQQMLVKLEYPLVTGIIRSYEDELFEEREAKLNEEVCKNSKFTSVDELFLSGETYEVK